MSTIYTMHSGLLGRESKEGRNRNRERRYGAGEVDGWERRGGRIGEEWRRDERGAQAK